MATMKLNIFTLRPQMEIKSIRYFKSLLGCHLVKKRRILLPRIIMAPLLLTMMASSFGEEQDCTFPDATTITAPGWICDETVDGLAISAVGVADQVVGNISFMRQQAAAEARVQLAQMTKVIVSNQIKEFTEETNIADSEMAVPKVVKQLTNERLLGARIYKSIRSPNGWIYVLVGMTAEH